MVETLTQRLSETVGPLSRIVWSNQVVVHVGAHGVRRPWATLHTKRPDALGLSLYGPKQAFGLGRIVSFGKSPEVDGQHPTHDVIQLNFERPRDFQSKEFQEFLQEHFQATSKAAATGWEW